MMWFRMVKFRVKVQAGCVFGFLVFVDMMVLFLFFAQFRFEFYLFIRVRVVLYVLVDFKSIVEFRFGFRIQFFVYLFCFNFFNVEVYFRDFCRFEFRLGQFWFFGVFIGERGSSMSWFVSVIFKESRVIVVAVNRQGFTVFFVFILQFVFLIRGSSFQFR